MNSPYGETTNEKAREQSGLITLWNLHTGLKTSYILRRQQLDPVQTPTFDGFARISHGAATKQLRSSRVRQRSRNHFRCALRRRKSESVVSEALHGALTVKVAIIFKFPGASVYSSIAKPEGKLGPCQTPVTCVWARCLHFASSRSCFGFMPSNLCPETVAQVELNRAQKLSSTLWLFSPLEHQNSEK